MHHMGKEAAVLFDPCLENSNVQFLLSIPAYDEQTICQTLLFFIEGMHQSFD